MSYKKSRILYVRRFLEAQTDEDHPASIPDILAYLDGIGVAAGRKTVADDIALLMEAGVDVVCNKGRQNQYFIGSRLFELPELKLLADAVQASKFVSPKKSKALIGKLTALAGVHQADSLNRQLYVEKQVKPSNEKVYITLDLLHTAINKGKQAQFKYYDYTPDKKKVYKHGGRVYRFSPYGLIWNSDHYYAAGFSESHGKTVTFRVDRIAVPELTDSPAVPRPEGFDMAVYANSVFRMYDGPEREVTLRCGNDLMKSVIDRFGENVETGPAGSDSFLATVRVSVSPTFFGWVFSFGGKMRIAAPEDVAEQYAAMMVSQR